MRYNSTPYAGNKSEYRFSTDTKYDVIMDCFAGSLGGTLELAIKNPLAKYYVAEASRCQRALINTFNKPRHKFDIVKAETDSIIELFFKFPTYKKASKWLSQQYYYDIAALSVMRRFFFSSILRTTPGSNEINVWISSRKILGDTKWLNLAAQHMPGIDYEADKQSYNEEFNEILFKSGDLKRAMLCSALYWYKSIQPLLTEWYASGQTITVFEDYKQLLDTKLLGDNNFIYVDPPYFNPEVGSFIDETGTKRTHKQTASYENHNPQSLETWKMFDDCASFGYHSDADMVLCNYSSPQFQSVVKALGHTHDLEFIAKDKACRCTGQQSKYFTVPLGKESVILATPKYKTGAIAA